MAHFAKLDNNNKVLQVIVVANEDAPTENEGQIFLEKTFGWEASKWKQTSYNTANGVHYDPNTNQPSSDQTKAFRVNFAGVGMIYDEVNDMFRGEKPYPSWTLDITTGAWNPPIPKPEKTETVFVWKWNEESQSWIENNHGQHDSN